MADNDGPLHASSLNTHFHPQPGTDLPETVVSGSTTPPTVIDILPTPGSSISRTTPCQFSVRDVDGNVITLCPIWVSYPDGSGEPVYNGTSFYPPFASSTVDIEEAGSRLDFVVTRTGGWLGSPSFLVRAVDQFGTLL